MLTAEWCLCVYVQIGKALMEALKKLVSEDKVPPALAVRVMKAFDRVRVYVTTQRKSVCVCVSVVNTCIYTYTTAE